MSMDCIMSDHMRQTWLTSKTLDEFFIKMAENADRERRMSSQNRNGTPNSETPIPVSFWNRHTARHNFLWKIEDVPDLSVAESVTQYEEKIRDFQRIHQITDEWMLNAIDYQMVTDYRIPGQMRRIALTSKTLDEFFIKMAENAVRILFERITELTEIFSTQN